MRKAELDAAEIKALRKMLDKFVAGVDDPNERAVLVKLAWRLALAD